MLTLQPITFSEAREFVKRHHIHHLPPVGCKFCVAVSLDGLVVGVAIVGRPVARGLDNGWTLEVTRCCTNTTRDVASMLYGACWRAAKALGYRRLVTYTLKSERGTALIAAGWRVLYETRGGSWNCKSRPRVDHHPTEQKLLWEAI